MTWKDHYGAAAMNCFYCTGHADMKPKCRAYIAFKGQVCLYRRVADQDLENRENNLPVTLASMLEEYLAKEKGGKQQ